MTLENQINNSKIALKKWLQDDCLPLWADKGLDIVNGGFFEQLNQDLSPNNIARRTRVAARQIYTFALARKMGFGGSVDKVISHGLEYLHTKCMASNGYLYAVLGPNGEIIRGDFDLYDHAFYLLGLASAYGDNPQITEYKTRAEQMRDNILKTYWRDELGFEEAIPPILPLKANPHMHMFEACLAWIEAGDDNKWRELAGDIAELGRTKFFDKTNCAILEFFDADWEPIETIGSRTIEPGHQFEWAWLFLRWAKIANDNSFIDIAQKLIETGEKHGIDEKRGLAFMSYNDANIPIDFSARLWSQTERIKAHVAHYKVQNDNLSRQKTLELVQKSIRGLEQYFDTPVRGMYYDRIDANGVILHEPSPTSSLYHIICAIDEVLHLEI